MSAWPHTRARVPWHDVVPHPQTPITTGRDGYPGRDAGHRAAHDDARHTTEPLSPALTARWNALIRGIPAVAFRTGHAYAKGGRERYDLYPGTEQQYAACLAEALDPGVPVTARAARAYLDVAFFHPYDDGNARLAAVVLRYVLRHGHVELDDPAPILTVIRRADDPHGAAGLARMVHGIAEATRRRHSSRTEFVGGR